MIRKRKRSRRWLRLIHLYLGLASGLIVFIVAATGCMLVFREEIKDLLYTYRKIAVEQRPYLQASELRDSAIHHHPGSAMYRLVISQPGRPVVISLNNHGQRISAYVNPYSGKVLHSEISNSGFFDRVQEVHTHLMLPNPIGQYLVSGATCVFVIMILTGLLLWFGGRRKKSAELPKINWNNRWRRLNYDLHSVPGFYAMIFLLAIATTGLSMNFPWLRNGLARIANLGKTYEAELEKFPASDTTNSQPLHADSALNRSFRSMKMIDSSSEMAGMYLPFGRAGVYSISSYRRQWHSYPRNDFYFDQFSGKPVKILLNNNRSAGAKLSAMNYDLHNGQVLGFGGKIIAFIASLIAMSLPVTGFLLWWGRRRKVSKTSR